VKEWLSNIRVYFFVLNVISRCAEAALKWSSAKRDHENRWRLQGSLDQHEFDTSFSRNARSRSAPAAQRDRRRQCQQLEFNSINMSNRSYLGRGTARGRVLQAELTDVEGPGTVQLGARHEDDG